MAPRRTLAAVELLDLIVRLLELLLHLAHLARDLAALGHVGVLGVGRDDLLEPVHLPHATQCSPCDAVVPP